MPMKLKYELSYLAQRDLENIWEYTSNQWSRKQANQYYKIIFKEIYLICDNPHIGRGIPHIKKHHRIHRIKLHLIIYKIDSNKIWVDRILHTKMDVETVLEG